MGSDLEYPDLKTSLDPLDFWNFTGPCVLGNEEDPWQLLCATELGDLDNFNFSPDGIGLFTSAEGRDTSSSHL